MNDIFLVMRHEDLCEILQSVNSVCPALQLTIKIETDCKLFFLNVMAERIESTDS